MKHKKLSLGDIEPRYLGLILAAHENKEGVLVEYPDYTSAHSARIKLLKLCDTLRRQDLPSDLQNAVYFAQWEVKDADGQSVGTRHLESFRAPFYLLGFRKYDIPKSAIESALEDQMPGWIKRLEKVLGTPDTSKEQAKQVLSVARKHLSIHH